MCFLVHHFLESSADANPQKEAVVNGSTRSSYQGIEGKANKIANWLLESGIRKGDRVALVLRNSVEYVCSYYGILKAGGIVVPLNTGLEASELEETLSDCSPRALITESHFLCEFQKILKNRPSSLHSLVNVGEDDLTHGFADMEYNKISEIYAKCPEDRPNVHLIDCDLSSIVYTSGSTGKPKGATLTHGNIVANTRSITSYLRLSQADRCTVVLPFYYVYGKSLLNTHFMVSATVVICNRMLFPNVVLEQMRKEKATGFAGVPSTFALLLNKSSLARMNFPDLRYVTQAGGHMPSVLKKELMRIFPHKEIFIMYGATEASARLSYLEPRDLSRKINSIGKAIPNVEVKIFTEDGGEAAPGEEGEVVARGSNVMQGYWNDPVETSKVIKNGWFHTGDLGYRDDEGFFFVTGRKRDLIKAGIYKLSAIEVEDVIYHHPDVYEVAVVGVPDQNLVEAPVAFIALKDGSNIGERDIIEFCERRLPRYKIPQRIVLTDRLPKNESGKVQKRKLVEALSWIPGQQRTL